MDQKPGHVVDIMATCLEVSGAEYPKERNGIQVLPKRGISLVGNIKGGTSPEHEFIFWEHEGHGAIRKGDWKLVSINAEDETLWELYNLKTDRTETKNLAIENPDKLEELKSIWEKMAYETKAWPKPLKETAKPNPIDY